MKLSLLKYKTNSFLKRNTALRASLPYKQALQIGIVFSVDDKAKHEEIKEFVKRLEKDGKQVHVISYLPKNKDNYEFMFDFFTDKDLSFWGNITSSVATRFADTPFDMLYYVDTVPNPMIMNIIARSKAKCRVGKFWEGDVAFFEMMIENTADIRSLIEGMYKYTQSLR